MGSAGFHDPLVFLFQPLEGFDQQPDGGQQLVFHCKHCRNVHGRGKGVVGGLAHIDVIVGVTELFAGNLIGSVGNNLVGVHVGLSTGACLPDHQREVLVQCAGKNLIAGLFDHCKLFLSHFFGSQLGIGHGCRLFQNAESMGDFSGHGFNSNADSEIFMAPLGLGGPELVCRDLYFSHRVVFDTIFHFFYLFLT